jgi:cephalosporin hydroxylase
MNSNSFESAVWKPGRMTLNGWVYRLEGHATDESWDGVQDFVFYKCREIVDAYAKFFAEHRDIRTNRVIELGIWDGGSVAFWNEVLQPEKLVALDNSTRGDSPSFQRFIQSKGLEGRLKTFWNTDQGNGRRLREIVEREFNGTLDIVIDDASHVFEPTLASFEVLFPMLAPGGFYFIEDWQWFHEPEHEHSPMARWVAHNLSRLAVQLMESVGTSDDCIASVTVTKRFLAIERGKVVPPEFRLYNSIYRIPLPPPPSLGRRAARKVRKMVAAFLGGSAR